MKLNPNGCETFRAGFWRSDHQISNRTPFYYWCFRNIFSFAKGKVGCDLNFKSHPGLLSAKRTILFLFSKFLSYTSRNSGCDLIFKSHPGIPIRAVQRSPQNLVSSLEENCQSLEKLIHDPDALGLTPNERLRV